VCARAPGLISVRDPDGCRIGDMMVYGVTPQVKALRPLILLRPSTRAWRRWTDWSWPRRIDVNRGVTRTERESESGGLQRLVSELAERVIAALQ